MLINEENAVIEILTRINTYVVDEGWRRPQKIWFDPLLLNLMTVWSWTTRTRWYAYSYRLQYATWKCNSSTSNHPPTPYSTTACTVLYQAGTSKKLSSFIQLVALPQEHLTRKYVSILYTVHTGTVYYRQLGHIGSGIFEVLFYFYLFYFFLLYDAVTVY